MITSGDRLKERYNWYQQCRKILTEIFPNEPHLRGLILTYLPSATLTPSDTNDSIYTHLGDILAESGCLEAFQYYNDRLYCTTLALNQAINNAEVEMVEWLINNRSEGYEITPKHSRYSENDDKHKWKAKQIDELIKQAESPKQKMAYEQIEQILMNKKIQAMKTGLIKELRQMTCHCKLKDLLGLLTNNLYIGLNPRSSGIYDLSYQLEMARIQANAAKTCQFQDKDVLDKCLQLINELPIDYQKHLKYPNAEEGNWKATIKYTQAEQTSQKLFECYMILFGNDVVIYQKDSPSPCGGTYPSVAGHCHLENVTYRDIETKFTTDYQRNKLCSLHYTLVSQNVNHLNNLDAPVYRGSCFTLKGQDKYDQYLASLSKEQRIEIRIQYWVAETRSYCSELPQASYLKPDKLLTLQDFLSSELNEGMPIEPEYDSDGNIVAISWTIKDLDQSLTIES